MASKRVKDGPHWVKAWISELSALTDQFRDIETGAVDFEALGREEYHFRMALSRRDFTNSERARKVWEDAVGNYQQRIKAASKYKEQGDAARREAADGGRPKSITATTPQPSAISTDGPRQAENAQAEAGAPSHGGSVANSYAHEALDSLDDKASDQGEGNTANVQPSDGPEDGNLEVTTKNQNDCGADAVSSNTTEDRNSGTSAPQQRPWKEMVEKSLGISETDTSGTEKGVRPPNPVPGLLSKRRAAGSPLKPGTGPSPAARSLPKSMSEVSDFACSENLDYDDCRLWWEQNFVERKGRDKEGKKITNWRGALIRFCASAKRKRESA